MVNLSYNLFCNHAKTLPASPIKRVQPNALTDISTIFSGRSYSGSHTSIRLREHCWPKVKDQTRTSFHTITESWWNAINKLPKKKTMFLLSVQWRIEGQGGWGISVNGKPQ